MSDLTPKTARAAATAYVEKFGVTTSHDRNVIDWFRAEADRLEAAARSAGQVLAESAGMHWDDVNPTNRDLFERRAAAVIAHHTSSARAAADPIGPDRVVVDREDLHMAWVCGRLSSPADWAVRLRKALG